MAKSKNATTEVETKEQAPEETPTTKDLAVEAYDLFRKAQSEGDFPEWSELPGPTQTLWLEGYNHVASGREPRTQYEQVVRALIVPAQ